MIGAAQPLTAFQTTINDAIGVNRDHIWFFGTDENYWESSVKCQRLEEYEDLPSSGPMGREVAVYNTAEATIADLVTHLDLEERDRICYLFDYGSERRFYTILKEVLVNEPSDTGPTVVNENGDPIVQYPPQDKDSRFR